MQKQEEISLVIFIWAVFYDRNHKNQPVSGWKFDLTPAVDSIDKGVWLYIANYQDFGSETCLKTEGWVNKLKYIFIG